MSKRDRVETGKAPEITIELIEGDLVVRSWPEPVVELTGKYDWREVDGAYFLNCDGDLSLMVPLASSLHIANVSGDLVVKGELAALSIGAVHGDAVLSSVSHAKCDTVHGDLSAKHFAGDLSVERVHGDLSARHVGQVAIGSVFGDCLVRHADGSVAVSELTGDVNLSYVSGDVDLAAAHGSVALSQISGLVNADDVKGDVRLRGGLNEGRHSISAAGSIMVRWPSGSGLSLRATAPKIESRMLLEDESREGNTLVGRIGDGSADLSLVSAQRILLKEVDMIDDQWDSFEGADFGKQFEFDAEAIGARVQAEIDAQMARMTADMERRFGPEFAQRISDKVARKAEKAAARAERAAERARHRTQAGSRGFDFVPPPAPSKAPPPRTASVEEQLKILRMVENGAISPEEANILLEALEG